MRLRISPWLRFSNAKSIIKWAGIVCGGLIGLFIVIVIIGAITSSDNNRKTVIVPTSTPIPPGVVLEQQFVATGAVASSGNDGNSVTTTVSRPTPIPPGVVLKQQFAATGAVASSGNDGSVVTVAIPTYKPLPTPTPILVAAAIQTRSTATDREALLRAQRISKPSDPAPTSTVKVVATPTPTYSERMLVFRQELEELYKGVAWGFEMGLYDNGGIVLHACLDYEVDTQSVARIAEVFVDTARLAYHGRKYDYIYIQLHRCKDDYQYVGFIPRKDCVRSIAYEGFAGNSYLAGPGGSLKQHRGEGGLTMDGRFRGGSIGHCAG